MEGPTGTCQLLLSQVMSLLEGAGPLGYMCFMLCFTAWVVVCLPTTPIEVAAGYMYGPVWGPMSGLLCKTVGSYVALISARLVGQRRGWTLPDRLKPKLDMLNKQPVATMISIRLAPLPLAVKNYGLAFTDVSSPAYIFAASVVNTPFSIMWGAIGASCPSLAEALNSDSPSRFTASTGVMGMSLADPRFLSMVFCGSMVCYLCFHRQSKSTLVAGEDHKFQVSGKESSCAANLIIVGACEELKDCCQSLDSAAKPTQSAEAEEAFSDALNTAWQPVAAREKVVEAGHAERGTFEKVLDALKTAMAESCCPL